MFVDFISRLNVAAEKVSTCISSSWLGRVVTPYLNKLNLDKLPTIHPLVKGAVVVGAVFTAVIVKCVQKYQETKNQNEMKSKLNKMNDEKQIIARELETLKIKFNDLNEMYQQDINDREKIISRLSKDFDTVLEQNFSCQETINKSNQEIQLLKNENKKLKTDNELKIGSLITKQDNLNPLSLLNKVSTE